MRNILKVLSVVLLLVGTVATTQAQKLAYTNSAALLSEFPDVKRLDASLETLQKQLVKKGENMVKKFETEYKAAAEKEKRGELSPKQISDLRKNLETKQQDIVKYEQDIQNQLVTKRNKELEPILKKVQDAINAVAKEKGYDYVVDASTGILLYAADQHDITTAVKSKLGIAQ